MRKQLCGVLVLVALHAGCGASQPGSGEPTEPTAQDARAEPPREAGVDENATGSACSSGGECDGTTGLCVDPRTCTASAPCENALVGIKRMTVTEPLTTPVCRTTSATRPAFDDGPARAWTDAVTGDPRAACVYTPPGTGPGSKRPLLVYLHGAGGSASAVYDTTSLRQKAASFDLSGDPARPGFILASDQGRNLQNTNGNPPSSRHEIYRRDLKTNSSAADFRNLDRLVDELVVAGGVDEKRIYVTGWSNGAFFGQLYTIARHRAPTPGGNRVAAAAVFDGADPFQRPRPDAVGCDYVDVPKVSVPLFLVHRACSIVPCDSGSVGLNAIPGFDVLQWETRLKGSIGARDVTRVGITARGERVDSCPAPGTCTEAAATLNHVRWPDGVADGSGKDWEVDLLDYLRAHPLP